MSFYYGTAGDRIPRRKNYSGKPPPSYRSGAYKPTSYRDKTMLSPNMLAVLHLVNELKSYNVTSGLRSKFKQEFVEMEQLHNMNMQFMAAAIILIDKVGIDETSIGSGIFNNDVFRDMQDRIFDRYSSPEGLVLLKEELLIYIFTILAFRKSVGPPTVVFEPEIDSDFVAGDPDAIPLPEGEEAEIEL